MGNLHSAEFADAVNEGSISLEQALEYQLFTNHFPPLPRACLELAMLAIKAIKDGEPDTRIDISAVGSHKEYGTAVPASECANAWHLWDFIRRQDDE